jgi:hypothetical protein
LHDLIRVKIEQTWPMSPLRFRSAGPLVFVLAEYTKDALAMDASRRAMVRCEAPE